MDITIDFKTIGLRQSAIELIGSNFNDIKDERRNGETEPLFGLLFPAWKELYTKATAANLVGVTKITLSPTEWEAVQGAAERELGRCALSVFRSEMQFTTLTPLFKVYGALLDREGAVLR